MASERSRCVLVLGVALSIASGAARADSEPLRIAVRVGSPADDQLVQRLRGQLSDVSVELVPVSAPPGEPSGGAFEPAQFARAHVADAVLWFEPRTEPTSELGVQLWADGRGSLPSRGVAAPAGARGSDVLEAAALVARSSVVALVRALAEAPSNVAPPAPTPAVLGFAPAPSVPPLTAAEATIPAAEAVPPAPEPRAELPAPKVEAAPKSAPVEMPEAASAAPRLTPRFFVGAQAVIDGVSDVGQHALAVRFGLMLEQIAVSIYGSASLGSAVSDPWVDLRLTRHGAGVAVDLHRRLWGVFRGAAGVHAGAAFYLRSSLPKHTRVGATGTALMTALTFGPEVALEYRPDAFGLGLHLALDVVPSAPSFRLQTDQGVVQSSHAPWVLEPRLGVGLEGRL